MMSALEALVEGMERAHVGAPIIARVVRMNSDWQANTMPRGIHRKRCKPPPPLHYLGKREFIRQFGREAWDALRRQHRWRSGRRQFVLADVVVNRAWEAWQGRPFTDHVVVVEPDRFANEIGQRLTAYRAERFLAEVLPRVG